MYFNGYQTELSSEFKGKEPCGPFFKLYSQVETVIPDYLSGIECPHRFLVPTGVTFNVKEGYGILVYGRNALSSIHGIFLMSNVVVTNESYGELKVAICNLGREDFILKKGDIVANGIVFKTK